MSLHLPIGNHLLAIMLVVAHVAEVRSSASNTEFVSYFGYERSILVVLYGLQVD